MNYEEKPLFDAEKTPGALMSYLETLRSEKVKAVELLRTLDLRIEEQESLVTQAISFLEEGLARKVGLRHVEQGYGQETKGRGPTSVEN